MNSDNVFVFPCASRDSKYDLNAKLMSEKNITNMIKSITDNESYIISWDGATLKCVLRGYYFQINNEVRSGNKYAKLNVSEDGVLAGDNSGTFSGLTIDSDSTGADLVLCIDGKVPKESWSKFEDKSLNMTGIDCGELR